MRKYSVFSLSVVEVLVDSHYHYLICKKDQKGNYVEVLNGEKIVVEDEKCVTPLSKYYSTLAVCNYTTGKHLMLSRRDILRKYIDINVNKAIYMYEERVANMMSNNSNEESIKERLERTTKEMFPEEGSWRSSEFGRPENSLIGHLRDDKWLAYKLQSLGLEDIYFGTIFSYVKNSDIFKSERDAYEQRIVKWQINWMVNGGEGWLASEEFGGDFIGFDKNCDIGFRLGILNTLEAIGMDHEAIERGIEENASLWREKEIRSAFINNYEPIIELGSLLGEMVPAPEEHKNAWMKMRLYEYYKDHKDSIDKYGEVTPEMQMSDEEVENLKLYLEKLHEDRMAYLEELKTKERPVSKVLVNMLSENW